MSETTEPLISVVICTRNRSQYLAWALESLMQQTLDPKWFEILVVDNNSDDNTAEVVRNAAPEGRIRYVIEPVLGLSVARNRGWREARGKYIGWLDDDAKPVKTWLEVAHRIITGPGYEIFGGPFIPFYDLPKPVWYKDEYGSRILSDTARELDVFETLSGNNFFMRRDLLVKHGGFKSEFGMTGNKIAYGEESELQIRIRHADPSVRSYYDPDVLIEHLVRVRKIRFYWFFETAVATARDTIQILMQYQPIPPMPQLAWTMTKSIAKIGLILLGLPFRNRREYPYFQNYLIDRLTNPLRRIIGTWHQIKRRLAKHDSNAG